MKFTKIKNNQGLLTKVFTKTKDGYKKEVNATLYRGKISIVDIEFKELDSFLNALEANEAIILGIPNGDETSIGPSWNLLDGEIARSKRNFDFTDEQLLLFDIDVEMSPDEAIVELSKLDPRFSTTEMLIRYGTSSYIYDPEKKEYCTKGTSLHIYVPSTGIDMLPDYIDSLCKRSWEVGSAYIKVNAVGAMLERFIFDATVFSPERLVFEAGAVCRGLEQRKPESIYRAGSKLKLHALDYDEQKALREKSSAKKEKKQEAQELLGKFTKKYVGRVNEVGLDETTIDNDIDQLSKGRIPPNLILYDLNGGHFRAGSIDERMDQLKIQDPIDPNGMQKAMIYWNNGSPVIHSFKSGTFHVELYDSEEKYRRKNILLGYEYSQKGKLLPTLESLKALLAEYDITYEYDLLKKSPKLMHDNIDWTLPNPEQMSLQLIRDIAYRMNMPISIIDTIEALSNDKHYVRNPMMLMVKNGYEKWSLHRKDWISELVRVLQPEADINHELISKWLIQCVAAWDFDELSPINNKQSSYEGVLVLQGEQGVRKTTFFRKILPMEMDEYFKEGAMLNPDNKDSVKQCTSYAITELGELEATFNKSDIGALKAFLSNRYDEYRLPYARKEEKHRRSVSFCGTVNDQQFLRDRSGARRFWLIPIKSIDMNLMDSIPKEELWGQVYDLYLKGASWHIDVNSDTYTALKEIHERFEAYSPAHDVLAHIDECSRKGVAKIRLSASKMFKDLELHHSKADVDALAQKLSDQGVHRYDDRSFRVSWAMPPVL